METRYTSLRLCVAATLMALLTLDIAAAPPAGPPADDMVVLTGWLHVHDLDMRNVLLRVEVNGSTQRTRVSENGRFVVALPKDSEARLRFEKPGHMPKEVLVHTRHSMDSGEPSHKPRRVKLAVVLELERHMAGLTYAGPVGTIGFEEGGGCVAVEHHKNMVPGQRRQPMVF